MSAQLVVDTLFDIPLTPKAPRLRSYAGGGDASPDYVNPPATQGIKYAGAKTKLLPYILAEIRKLPGDIVFDGFSGSTRVSQALAKSGFHVISSDIAYWSECMGNAFLFGACLEGRATELISHLNAVKPVEGWFSARYGWIDHGDRLAIADDGTRRVWQLKNSMRIDAIREEIDRIALTSLEKDVAITSLILAADRVDSTVGHYASFLREWSPRSYDNLRLEVPSFCPLDDLHCVLRLDIREALDRKAGAYDLLYLDPPYGSNNDRMPSSRVRYQAYYNLWTTLVRNDRPQTFGRSNRRVDSSDKVVENPFEDFRRDQLTGRLLSEEAIEEVLDKADCEYIVVSYSTEGRIAVNDFRDLLSSRGKVVRCVALDHRRNVMSAMRWTNEWAKSIGSAHKELLFTIKTS